MKLYLVILLLVFSESYSQNDSMTYNLKIYSNFDSSLVYIDSVFKGYTPFETNEIPVGIYFIEVKRGIDNRDWDIQEIEYSMSLVSDTILIANFKYYYFINSSPTNALVFYNNTLLGETPLRYFPENKLNGNLILKKEMYDDLVIDVPENKFEIYGILKQKPGVSDSKEIVYNKNTGFKTPRNYAIISLLSAAVLGTGYSAYRTKTVSNQLYRSYEENGFQNDLESSDRQNIYFYVSLALMQAAIGGLIYFLFIK